MAVEGKWNDYFPQTRKPKQKHADVDMDGNDSSDNEDPSFHVDDDDDMFCDIPTSRRQISSMCK